MRESEILALARQAGIAPGVSVLDLCCGAAGPGRLITRELRCDYLGVDASAAAVAIACERAGDLPCRFEVARIPPVPAGRFDVVLLLETMLAFRDKDAVLRSIADALTTGGRFAFTFEAGAPLTDDERQRMPDADTVWLTPLGEMLALLRAAGLVVTWQEDHSRSHRATAQALLDRGDLGDLFTGHRLWVEWLDAGRVRKFALVARRPG
jgi:SAM-dependent methyltransferase